MTEQQAVTIAQEARPDLGIDQSLTLASAQRAIVEFAVDRTRPVAPEDRVAWIVEFAGEIGLVRVHVDDRTGQILGVKERL